MKRPVIAAFLLLVAILCPVSAHAHPPKAPSVSWDANAHLLTVNTVHVVSNPAKHHVMALVVLNSKGESLFTKQYAKQASTQTFSDSVTLQGTLPGDRVTVRLVCNIMGTSETSVVLK